MASKRFFGSSASRANRFASNNNRALDISGEIIGDTPDGSPAYERQPTSRRKDGSMDSDISQIDISNVGAKQPQEYRSPQIILDTDDEDDSIKSPSAVDSSLETSCCNVPIRRTNRITDSSDDDNAYSHSENEKPKSNGDNLRKQKDASRTSKYDDDAVLISEDEDVHDDDRGDDSNDSEENNVDETIDTSDGLDKDEDSVRAEDSSDSIERSETPADNVSSDASVVIEDRKSPGSSKSPSPDTSIIKGTVRKKTHIIVSDSEDEEESSASENEKTPVSRPVLERKQVKTRKVEQKSDDSVICLSGSDDSDNERKETSTPSNNVASDQTMTKEDIEAMSSYTQEDIKELESQIRKTTHAIAQNEYICNTRGKQLRDGGASLRHTIKADKAKLSRLRETLGKARTQLARIHGGVLSPSLSGNSPNGHASPDSAYWQPHNPKMIKSVSGSTLTPIDNLSVDQRLQIAKKQRRDFENLLKYSSNLTDGGQNIRNAMKKCNEDIENLEKQLNSIQINQAAVKKDEVESTQRTEDGSKEPVASGVSMWNTLKQNFSGFSADEMKQYLSGAAAANPLYGGKMNKARREEVRTVTTEAMERIHKDLETIPTEADEEEDPVGLKSNIKLYAHQKQALAWMLWRETRHPPGGILADDMGLGKTLEMISLILKHKEIEAAREKEEVENGESKDKENNSWNSKGKSKMIMTKTTLLVCPASLMGQWENEVKTKVKSGRLNVLVYHGTSNRSLTTREMARYDIIITTYGVILSEVKSELGKDFAPKKFENMGVAEDLCPQHSRLLSLAFERIILDEAHTIRNPKSSQSIAVTKLRAVRRWCVTGTPIQNKELDMYSLIRFLRVSPFDEYRMWQRWIDNKTAQGAERLNLLVKSILLRRTKEQKCAKTGEILVDLPTKNINCHQLDLDHREKAVYDKLHSRSKAVLERFIDQQKEKAGLKEAGAGSSYNDLRQTNDFAFRPGGHNMSGDQEEVKAHQILLLLLRLRQVCCHPSLIKGMLDSETRSLEGLEDAETGEDLDLVSQLEDLAIDSKNKSDTSNDPQSVLDLSNPIFDDSATSSKIRTVLKYLKKLEDKEIEEGVKEKAVIVSQWTSMLNIVRRHLRREGYECVEITGNVNIKERAGIVQAFNRQNEGPQVMLLSMAAGGVGLNLVGANHLFILDVHWNPQMENQAMDRIYRVGQKKDVKIHKFMVKGTIEEGIMALQERKMKLSDEVLSGAKKRSGNKLSLEELKFLFSLQ